MCPNSADDRYSPSKSFLRIFKKKCHILNIYKEEDLNYINVLIWGILGAEITPMTGIRRRTRISEQNLYHILTICMKEENT